MKNNLKKSASLYLRQHAQQPVFWQTWHDDAFRLAQERDCPVLLSIGYSACHWCHVMARESFADTETAAYINAHFIALKVDREERPDIDGMYQNALSFMGQHGGWPLTMFLTPNGHPFAGGTYFPKHDYAGMPAFMTVLTNIVTAWQTRRQDITTYGRHFIQQLKKNDWLTKSPAPMTERYTASALRPYAESLLRATDPVWGGLGETTKFPQCSLLRFLWWCGCFYDDRRYHDAVLLTLDKICLGGLYDHLGGGFARYTVEREWLVPHFEKMLYDNAQLIALLALAWQKTGLMLYKERIIETIDWCHNVMRIDKPPLFAASIDADSDGSEGQFYVWQYDTIKNILGDKTDVFCHAYDASPEGNWQQQIILNRRHLRAEDIEQQQKKENQLKTLRKKLWLEREKRKKPTIDNKILCDWNAMMICAFCSAAWALQRNDWLVDAEQLFASLWHHMKQGNKLLHMLGQDHHVPQFIDDYAHLAQACLSLYQLNGQQRFLRHAIELVKNARQLFWLPSEHLYRHSSDQTAIGHKSVIFDQAIPVGNAVMTDVLIRLWLITADMTYYRQAEQLLERTHHAVFHHFPSAASLLNAGVFFHYPLKITVGKPLEHAVQHLALTDFVLQRHQQDDAILCHGQQCFAPSRTLEELNDCLNRHWRAET